MRTGAIAALLVAASQAAQSLTTQEDNWVGETRLDDYYHTDSRYAQLHENPRERRYHGYAWHEVHAEPKHEVLKEVHADTHHLETAAVHHPATAHHLTAVAHATVTPHHEAVKLAEHHESMASAHKSLGAHHAFVAKHHAAVADSVDHDYDVYEAAYEPHYNPHDVSHYAATHDQTHDWMPVAAVREHTPYHEEYPYHAVQAHQYAHHEPLSHHHYYSDADKIVHSTSIDQPEHHGFAHGEAYHSVYELPSVQHHIEDHHSVEAVEAHLAYPHTNAGEYHGEYYSDPHTGIHGFKHAGDTTYAHHGDAYAAHHGDIYGHVQASEGEHAVAGLKHASEADSHYHGAGYHETAYYSPYHFDGNHHSTHIFGSGYVPADVPVHHTNDQDNWYAYGYHTTAADAHHD